MGVKVANFEDINDALLGPTGIVVSDAIESASPGSADAGEILISDTAVDPLVFGDLILSEDGLDFLYSD